MEKCINLSETFGKSYRITYSQGDDGWAVEDRPWLQQIEGKYGILFPYSSTDLGAIITSAKVAKALGVKRVKGEECQLHFPLSDGRKVLRLIKGKRKRQLSPEDKANRTRIIMAANEARKATRANATK